MIKVFLQGREESTPGDRILAVSPQPRQDDKYSLSEHYSLLHTSEIITPVIVTNGVSDRIGFLRTSLDRIFVDRVAGVGYAQRACALEPDQARSAARLGAALRLDEWSLCTGKYPSL